MDYKKSVFCVKSLKNSKRGVWVKYHTGILSIDRHKKKSLAEIADHIAETCYDKETLCSKEVEIIPKKKPKYLLLQDISEKDIEGYECPKDYFAMRLY